MRLLAVLLVLFGSLATPVDAAGPRGPRTAGIERHEVGYDRYSLTVDGRRVLLWAGEFHYFRLPSQELWRDVLEKIRAAGFNGVSLYFHWGYHSPAPGVYDFTGVRDVDRLLRMADELGLYVVARPGPYINAETTGGGFPAWLKTVDGRARSSDPGYTRAYREWLDRINPVLARHQVTRGGSVIAYNVENEYAVNVDPEYMVDLQERARAAGVDVPIVHNNCCGGYLANWASGRGAVQVPGVDDYPVGFDCRAPGTWGESDGVTRRLREDAPVYAAEYQAGAIDLHDAGYDACRELTGPDYMKVFYKSNLVGSGATMFGYYMTFGGTSWGWLPQPNDVYTSYDYGAAITEARNLTPKYDEFKRQGYFASTVAPLTRTDPTDAPAPADPAIATQARANPDTGTQFALVRHADRRTSADVSTTLAWTTPDGRYDVPVSLSGRDAKVLVAGYDLGGQRLVWSSSEILTHVDDGGRDVAVLYGREGEPGSTVLRYASAPSVRVLAGDVRSSYAGGDLRLDYAHTGLARVLVTGGGRPPALLLLGTDEAVAEFWRLPTPAGPVLVRGTGLVRSAEVRGDRLHLRADTDRAGDVEVFAPVSRLSVGGRSVPARRTGSGSLVARLAGPQPVELPALTSWRYRPEPPGAGTGWTTADKTTTASPIKPKTLPVLYSDEYGHHNGAVWYRGSFTATGAEASVAVNAITGRRGVYLVWLDGHYLGSAAGGTESDAEPVNPDPGRGDFAVPPGLLAPGDRATLTVLVENMGHNDDWTADDTRFKQPRGLFGVVVEGGSGPISWQVRGSRGMDERGPLNTGGLHGELSGWHLPDPPDRYPPDAPDRYLPDPSGDRHLPDAPGDWRRPPASVGPGVSWYRTAFRLDLPRDHDASLGLRFAEARGHRVLVYLNGWNVGQYLGDLSPQRDFVLPRGVLGRDNTLVLAVIATGSATPAPPRLVTLGNHRTGNF
ncbi:beta-galactosidase [Saccharothrix sp. Mg75]|uniref:beta-galactosidase n=1 Tax=Saccharothrix sp. Mg75 TaxID=3445357 RepID=UPI003EEB37B7